MAAWYRLKDWPLRIKFAALLVLASLLPLAVALWISIDNARDEHYHQAAIVLTARSDSLVGRIDALNSGYLHAVRRLAQSPTIEAMLQAPPAGRDRMRAAASGLLRIWSDSDSAIRGAAVLDLSGSVVATTQPRLLGANLAYRGFVRRALAGSALVSDIYIPQPELDAVPTLAFLAPLRAANGSVIGAMAFLVDASIISRMLVESNDLAGAGSCAVIFDSLGIRIAHSFKPDMQFHPGERLPPATIDALVTERRFGTHTGELLQDVRPVSWLAQASAAPDSAVFRGFAAGNDQWNLVVGRRSSTAPWTVYSLVPEATVRAEMQGILWQKSLFAGVIMLAALAAGLLFASAILRPLRALSAGARTLGGGNLDTRVAIDRGDELGELGAAFNGMADRIEQLAADRVRESERQYRTLFETMSEPFCTMDMIFDDAGKPVDFRFVETNKAFEAVSRLGDVRGKLRSELTQDFEQFWTEVYGRVALTGRPEAVEGRSKRLGRYFNVRAYRVGGPESRRVAILFEDITERRQAQGRREAQLESLNLLQQITRAIGERQDLRSIFQIVLRTLEERMPIDFGCICLRDQDPDQDRLQVSCTGERSQAMAGQMGLQEGTFIDVESNGLSRCVGGQLVYEPDVGQIHFPAPQRLADCGLRSLVCAPLIVESQVFGILVASRRYDGFSSAECEFLRQLSEHVALAAHHARLYTALQEAYEDLHQTQQTTLQQERLRALGQMSSGIAHDINNAISPITLYTDALLEHETHLSEAGRNQLQTIQRAITDVAATVARMRDFYRPLEASLPLGPVQLNNLVPQVVELTRARWSTLPQQRGITIDLHTQLQPGLPTIRGAENEIREALTNLVFNAVDAMPQGGELTLATRTNTTGQVLVEVRDTGVGMDEDSRRRCLEPFFTTKGERGTGLGLATVYGAAQRHGAQIEIESAEGKGTCVRLAFQAADAALPVTESVPVIAPRGLRILVVDDDLVLLRTLRDVLVQDGHVVVTADGGQQGIDLARAAHAAGQRFSVAFTDLGMPHVDGRQVARALKELDPTMPVIMLTGWGKRLAAEGDMPPGVDTVLSKPPSVRKLREALAGCCATSTDPDV